MFLRQLPPELNHLRRIIDGDDLPRVFGQQLRKRPLACSQIGDCQWRKQRNERMRQRFPGAARHITAAKLAGKLIEVSARFVLTFVKNKLQTGPIA